MKRERECWKMKINNTMFEKENQGVHLSSEQFTESRLEQKEN